MARYQSFNINQGNSNLLIKDDPFDFTGAIGYNLKFQMMHDTGYASNTDRITVCASTDGSSFFFMGTFNRYDGTTGWATHSVDLSAFAGLPAVWIGFYAESFYGNNMFIDDVNLEAIGLSYEYDQTVTTTLNAGETKNVVFPAWIPSDVGQYIVTACTLLIGDCNPSNDCISEIINLTLDTTPNTPTQPSGTTSGYICISYNYSTSTTDPDGDNVKYGWDWDDGSPIEWSDWYSSGDTCTMSHSWDDPGTYDVRVKAMDTWGNESGWSLQLTVIMANHPPNTPSNPNPTNGASNVDINADLSWTGGDPDSCDTVTYDVYFGTTSPPPKVVGNQSDTSYNPGTMNYNTHYYWKIVAWDNHSASTLGPLWSFTTKANTPPVFGTPSPINGSTNNPLSLSWSIPINDPEGDQFSWTIQCSNGQVNSGTGATNGTKSLALSGLAYSTTYKVWVNATDPTGSGLYTRKWYTFTTKASQPPVFGSPSPANGSTNNPLSLTWSIPINDPEGDTFSWTIQCSNGQVNSGTGATNGTKSLALSGLAYSTTYKVWVNATDPTGSGTYTRKWYTFTTQQQQNVPPNKPNKPSGTTSGKINTVYTYTTSTTDPNGDQVYYMWDWGDGSQSSWLGPYNSGVTISTTHKWTVKGSYSIKVKAKDNSGAESAWSDPLSITMPYSYNQPILQFLELLFERFPHAFPILRYLLGY
jgi:hypothetical protein